MKKILLALAFGYFLSGTAQENESISSKKNEMKINAAFLVAGALEVSYERIINEESAFGASLLLAIDDDIDTKVIFTPYYRYYFGKKPAAGFFAEGFGMLNNYESYKYNTIGNESRTTTRTDFALGFGLGAKWITKKGFIFEINGGVGRNLFNSSDTDYEIVGRGGITFGYRFN
ncbi:hypothetical protein BXU11_02330 [Flavobacterium sp. LM5]|jgi:hypothetical protein|uniref:DUF3575 domain-containing protein n=1 Tax=Flavobacterium sp. LM5 TaxID=1938610 RepID=UPI0009934DA1|nr:DUF3575 domain-containing protein [Flavobacterium sp. LM5]OOV28801.1 hypothetical protein BXU11_02330 [Flavobacterium sp. LM5]